MNFRLLLSSILIVSVHAQAEQLTFGQDEDLLRKCIKDHLSTVSNLKIGKSVESIAEMVSNKFFFRSYTKRQFDGLTSNIYYSIRNEKSHLFSNNIVPEKLLTAIRTALQNCVERYNLPRFDDELHVFSDLLDYVLVDWPIPVHLMIRTHEGRSTLRLYAYAAGMRLMSALRHYSMDYEKFRRQLRRIWMRRAEQYYDDRSQVYYIQHRFTTCRDRMYSSVPLEDIHTVDDISTFELRSSVNFSSRNLVIRQRNSSCPEDDVYIEYSQHGVTSAENFLEVHMDRFQRTIFFILELQLRGISSDEDDIYSGPVPSDIMPTFNQEIVRHNTAYQSYLRILRQYLEQFPIEEIGGCSFSGTTEELISRLTLLVVEKTRKKTAVTTTTSTEFPRYEGGSKKGGARTKGCGKYFIPNKRSRTVFSAHNQQSGFIDNNFNYYGQILFNGGSNELGFLDGNVFISPEILVNLNLDIVLAAFNFSSFN